MGKRPNIIIFNPDEMRWDTMGHMGNPAAVTPFLDRFAKTEAVSFSNAYCQNPVCVPSRCSFFTGLYPHTAGHRTMGHLLRSHETSLLKELKEAGYYVWANARNDLVSANTPGLIESHVTELFYGGNVPAAPGPVDAHYRGRPESPQFYAFCNGKLQTDKDGLNYTSDDEDVDAACYRIRNRVDDRPLCLFVGTLYPHPAYNVEEPYYSGIDRGKLPRRITAGETTKKPSMETALRKYQNLAGMTGEQWDELRAVYLGMCTKVDAQFKKLCDALKEAGEYDNSAIFFFSDHGDYEGDFDISEKAQNCFEDVLIRVPLLIKPPRGMKVDVGITDSFAELVDFYATAMELAEVTPGHTHFGRSLLPVVGDRSCEVRDCVFCEGGRMAGEDHCSESVDPAVRDGFRYAAMWPRYAAQHDHEAHAKGAMIRTAEWKYVYRAHGMCELYDLRRDPLELHNISGSMENCGVETAMMQRILEWYQDTCDVVPFDKDERFSDEMIWEKVKLLVPPGCEQLVRDKIASKAGLFVTKIYCQELADKMAGS
ncbi:MAG: sulfatase-like hydrolase/transferase [Hungatella sp.]|jgi:arylsulfatase A-like enzyme|nr:sulfatase-like hydrolase/transferase [Hungatella sp.]